MKTPRDKSRTHLPKRRRDSYTATEADNALCIMEWLMQVNQTNDPGRDDRIIGLYSDYGWGGMRSACLQAGVIAEDVFQYAKGPNDQPEFFDNFDWDFVPAFCRVLEWETLLQDNQYGNAAWRGNPKAIWAAMVAIHALKARAA